MSADINTIFFSSNLVQPTIGTGIGTGIGIGTCIDISSRSMSGDLVRT